MLHLSHYYACYYALLFLLYQQQQQAASSLTVIIDGATTSEWATRDQYKRIVEQQQLHHQNQQQHQQPGYPRRAPHNNHHTRLPGSPFEELPLALAQEQAAAPQNDNGNRQRTLEDAYQQQPEAGSFQQQQQQPDDSWPLNAGFLEDLATEGDRVSDEANELQPVQGSQQAPPRIRGRESQLRKYCGYQLMDVLELVCQGRYYGGQPEVVEPTIKSRRSSRSRALHGAKQLDSQQTPIVVAGQEDGGGPLAIDKPPTRNSGSRKVLYRRIREEALWRGVTKECCDNPCRMEDLKNYCQPT